MLITTLMPPKWIRYAGELLVAVAQMHASHGQILRTDRFTPESTTHWLNMVVILAIVGFLCMD
jgi:succinate dehydrogenase hydrophobic anchor subunit